MPNRRFGTGTLQAIRTSGSEDSSIIRGGLLYYAAQNTNRAFGPNFVFCVALWPYFDKVVRAATWQNFELKVGRAVRTACSATYIFCTNSTRATESHCKSVRVPASYSRIKFS